MASIEPVPDTRISTPTDWEEMENLVNINFDRFILKVNEKRITILSKIRDLRSKETNVHKSIKQVEDMKYLLQDQMRNNLVVSLQERTIAEFDEKLSALQIEANSYTEYMFACSEKELERALSNFGGIELKPKHYLGKGVPKVTIGHFPDNPIKQPNRASFDESLDLIAVTDLTSKQIFLFSMSGNFIQSFGGYYFIFPSAVKIISNRELVVSDIEHQTICKVVFDRVKKTKPKITPAYNQAGRITSLDYDKDTELIYATSSTDHSVLVLTRDCYFVSRIRGFLKFPQSIFVSASEIYVWDNNNPSLHIISKSSHELIRSIIPCGIGLEVEKSAPFTLDEDGNVIIGKGFGPGNMVQIYSPSGQLIHSFSKEGNEAGELLRIINGIFVTKNKDLLVISRHPNFPIQIF